MAGSVGNTCIDAPMMPTQFETSYTSGSYQNTATNSDTESLLPVPVERHSKYIRRSISERDTSSTSSSHKQVAQGIQQHGNTSEIPVFESLLNETEPETESRNDHKRDKANQNKRSLGDLDGVDSESTYTRDNRLSVKSQKTMHKSSSAPSNLDQYPLAGSRNELETETETETEISGHLVCREPVNQVTYMCTPNMPASCVVTATNYHMLENQTASLDFRPTINSPESHISFEFDVNDSISACWPSMESTLLESGNALLDYEQISDVFPEVVLMPETPEENPVIQENPNGLVNANNGGSSSPTSCHLESLSITSPVTTPTLPFPAIPYKKVDNRRAQNKQKVDIKKTRELHVSAISKTPYLIDLTDDADLTKNTENAVALTNRRLTDNAIDQSNISHASSVSELDIITDYLGQTNETLDQRNADLQCQDFFGSFPDFGVLDFDLDIEKYIGREEDDTDLSFDGHALSAPNIPSVVEAASASDYVTHPKKKQVLCSRTFQRGQLWKFLLECLCREDYNPEYILWEDDDKGIFRIVCRDSITKLWAERRGKDDMHYDIMARAIRHYYRKGVIEPVRYRQKKMVFKFGPNAKGWKKLLVVYQTGEMGL